jgi:tRNA G37 N-methylase Trm5
MKPIAYFFTTKKLNARYNKKKEKVTEDQAVKWIAEDVARNMVSSRSKEYSFIIADYMNDDDFSEYYSLTDAYYLLKRDKARMAYHKFKQDVDFQEKVMSELKQYNQFTFEEEHETFSSWKKIRDYKKTYHIGIKQ